MNAIETIEKCFWDSSVRDNATAMMNELHARAAQDLEAAKLAKGRTLSAIVASANACNRAIEYLAAKQFGEFKNDMSAGIITLNIACKMLGLSAAQRTSIAVATW